jgi:small GTP-binding protein
MANKKIRLKVVSVGDTCVGKTSYLKRLIKNVYDENIVSTIGVDFAIKKVSYKGDNYDLAIWDTAGMERFRSICKVYYKDTDCFLIFYDVTNRVSFNNVKQWIIDIRLENSDIPIVLVGNKIDLTHFREVPEETAKEFAVENGVSFVEISVKNNSHIHLVTDMILLHAKPKIKETDTIIELKDEDIPQKCCTIS